MIQHLIKALRSREFLNGREVQSGNLFAAPLFTSWLGGVLASVADRELLAAPFDASLSMLILDISYRSVCFIRVLRVSTSG